MSRDTPRDYPMHTCGMGESFRLGGVPCPACAPRDTPRPEEAYDRVMARVNGAQTGSPTAPRERETPKGVTYQSVSLDEARKRLEEAVASVRTAEEAYERAKRITQKDLRFEVDV